MLGRLTRAGRLRAGKILASIYMLCVLMPALSLAFADGAIAAPCLTDPDYATGLVHIHETATGTVETSTTTPTRMIMGTLPRPVTTTT